MARTLIEQTTPIGSRSRLPLGEPSQLSKTEFLPVDRAGFDWVEVADRVYDSLRSYRRDHCAIFIDSDSSDNFLRLSGLRATYLDPDESWHWTGAQARPKLKPILIGDYENWFRWYMKWQRFNAFHVVVLIRPMQQIIDSDKRGYFDGFLTRLLSRPSVYRVMVVEEERFRPVVESWLGAQDRPAEVPELKEELGRTYVRQALAGLLYGTHLSTRQFSTAVTGTLFAKLNPDWETVVSDIKQKPALVDRMSRWIFTAGYHTKEMVETLETPEARESLENPEQELSPLFRMRKERGPSELSQEWLEGLAQSLLDLQGWFTVAGLYDYIQAQTQRVIQTSETFPKIFNDHYDHEAPSDAHVFLPSRPILRGIAERLAREGKLQKATWFREVGRPSAVYHLPSRLPFDSENRCGQCAFYVPLRRQCRIWWLLNRAYGYRHPRWNRDGERPLSAFEVYKMKNSWRIGPRSSACSRFVDKKKDYARKEFPEKCDTCCEPLPLPALPPKGHMVVCRNCRTRYFSMRRGKIKVLTNYEHLFKLVYQHLAGVDPYSDIKRLVEDSQSSAPTIVEQAIYDEHRRSLSEDPDSAPKTVMLFPGDRMIAREGRLFIFKKRSVESIPLAGSTLVDQGSVVSDEKKVVLESAGLTVTSPPGLTGLYRQSQQVRRYDIAPAVKEIATSNPEFLRKMSVAMIQSAIHATELITSQTKIPEAEVQDSITKQRMWLRRIEGVRPSKFLICEAMVMKEYWKCYYFPLKGALQRSGPRKKARFVREFVTDPVGRARGYTAVDAAINYLHQRRLLKARSINVQLSLDYNPGEGFLHRKKWNPDGLGLILDLIDPFKFADREKLLRAILDVSLNWRDFYGATDRHGARFYYPKPEALGVLEKVGEAADAMSVSYGGVQVALIEAYRNTVSTLIQNLQAGTPLSFTPFVY